MRVPRSRCVCRAPRSIIATLLAVLPLAAQEPTPTPTPATPPAEPPAATAPAAPAENEPAARPRPRRQAMVIEAGTVHPVAGPAIANGVVVIRGDRIVAVGKKGEVEVPANATVRSFPTGHVYPGLIDAATDAFTDASLRADGSADGGTTFVDDLRQQRTRADELVQAGITTAYVTVRSPAVVRGQGAIVRPRRDGFDVWQGKERAALQLRMTEGLVASHALQRQPQFAAADWLFEGLDEFRKAKTDHDEALKKYEKEFADYLAWHQKKKDGDKKPEAPAEAPKANETPAPVERQGPPREGRPRGNRGGGGGGGGGEPREQNASAGDPAAADDAVERALVALWEALAQDPAKQDPPKPGAQPAPAAPPPGAPTEKKDEAPKRPTYPKPPAADPQREALLEVVDGALPLRVEAHRADELHAVLRLRENRNIPVLVIEQAYGASTLVDAIAKAGVALVLTETLPTSFEPPYDTFDTTRLPALLGAAGVPFAIASGRTTLPGLLPLQAAAAIGRGLPADAALRAITLTPAEILGVAQDTGSLQAGKFADVLVTDRPLFATDSRVLLVLGKGRPEYEVQ
jgi:imidazolonepropionase-like amidohydrolase